MNEETARKIGTEFLKAKGLDVNPFGERDKLGKITDYNIFYSSPIVGEDGEFYIGGHVLLIDKRTEFCLVVASSPNFYEYQVRLFRIIIIHQLHDNFIDYEQYQKKKENIEIELYVNAIFLLLESHPENQNAFIEFLEILKKLDGEETENKMIDKLTYRSLSGNPGTLEIFVECFVKFKSNSLIKIRVQELDRILSRKDESINKLHHKYDLMMIERQKEIEEIKLIYMEEINRKEK